MPDPYVYYTDQVPEQLHFTSLRDHGKLLTWTLFQPSLLKYYLWRALGANHANKRLSSLTVAWSQMEIRNVLVMAAAHGLLGAILLSMAVSLIQNTQVQWTGLALNAAAGLVLSALIAFFMFRARNLETGIALGAVLLVTLPPAFGVIGGVQPRVLWLATVLVTLALAIVTPTGVARAMIGGDARVLFYGVIAAIGAGLLAGIELSIALLALPQTPLEYMVMLLLTIPAILALSRFIIYPFELLWIAVQFLFRGDAFTAVKRHPGTWDEMMILPAFGLDALLSQALAHDLAQGLALARQITSNPFQRWAVQRALARALRQSSDPIALLYTLLQEPHFFEDASFRVTEEEVTDNRSVRAFLLAELGGKIPYAASKITQEFSYYSTFLLRDHRATVVYPFARLLYMLLDEEWVNSAPFSLRSLGPQFDNVSELPHGIEIGQSFSALAEFLEWQNIEQIAGAAECVAWAEALTDVLRPGVVHTLKGLAEIGAEIALYQSSSSRVNRLAALSRATAGLDVLSTRVSSQVHIPEVTLLLRVIRQWQSLIARASGKLGEEALREMMPQARQVAGGEGRKSVIWQRPRTPIVNPFKAGEPVYPPLFVGRKDVFDRIGEVWLSKQNPDSIILYGHRRMGKTSIMRNLDQYAPPGSVLVYLDMKGATSFVQTTADLLLGIADAIHGAVGHAIPSFDVPAPDPSDYGTPARAQFYLDRLLRQVRPALADRHLILALDEFEAIEESVRAGRVGHEIYQYLRAKTQEPWLTVVFAGLHKLDEMSREYQEPFYGSYVNICVSYLSLEATRRLITNPTPDFPVNYESDVVKDIIEQTHGQPMLVQYICQALVNHLNHELFDLEREREICITPDDLLSVLSDDFIRSETRYFDGVWSQVRDHAEQVTILTTMARRTTAWSVQELMPSIGAGEGFIHNALEQLHRRDILAPLDDAPDQWRFLVPLMQRWITLAQG
jgi:hypothetical protein